MQYFLFTVLVLVLTACSQEPSWEKYDAGTLTFQLSDSRTLVEAECRRRGTEASYDSTIYGCMDFKTATVIAVKDWAVVAHEVCHWTTWTFDHSRCRTPNVK